MLDLEKLEITTESRKTLYYGRYQYKIIVPAAVHCGGLGYKSLHKNNKKYDELSKFRTLLRDLAQKRDISYSYDYRHSQEPIKIYLTNLSLVEEFICKYPELEIIKALVSEYLYFARKPNHKYRLFLKDASAPIEEFEKFCAYLEDNANDLRLSPSFADRIKSYKNPSWGKYKYPRIYMSKQYFIDFTDQNHHVMMALRYDNIIGKAYEMRQKGVDYNAVSSDQDDTEDQVVKEVA